MAFLGTVLLGAGFILVVIAGVMSWRGMLEKKFYELARFRVLNVLAILLIVVGFGLVAWAD